MSTLPLSPRTPEAEAAQYLTFFLGEEEYGVSLLRVREIIQYDTITRVPRTPTFIRGVINLRGTVVPVVDLGHKFGRPATTATRSTCIVIVEPVVDGERTVMGVLADQVSQVIELAAADVAAPPSFGAPVPVDYLVGMGTVGRRFVLLLDIDRILSDQEMRTTAEVSEAAPAAS